MLYIMNFNGFFSISMVDGGCPKSMCHCRARQPVIAALDAAISCIVIK